MSGTPADPWALTTAPGTSTYAMHRANYRGTDAVVCTVGSTVLAYDARCLDDLPAWLTTGGNWVELGAADEKKPAKDGTVEAWGRSADNPLGGWYGLRPGYRGRFGMYVPPLLELLGLVELEHQHATTGSARSRAGWRQAADDGDAGAPLQPAGKRRARGLRHQQLELAESRGSSPLGAELVPHHAAVDLSCELRSARRT